jgi:N-acetylmuramoyl-L-alanine amidase
MQKFIFFIGLICTFFSSGFNYAIADPLDIKITDIPIMSQERYDLMKDYAKKHYGINHANLISPKIIIIHYTAIATLGQSIVSFQGPEIAQFRDKLISYGLVNVGAHYLVDKEGNIFSMIPTTLMARHAIGYNYTAIAIENVAIDGGKLTDKQIRANAKLVTMLLYKHPSINYLIGHHEYMNQSYPHYIYYRAKISEYGPSIKIDPGFEFMRRLRFHLKRDYSIEFDMSNSE